MKRKMVREELDGQIYEYTPLGKYIVSAPGVCRGRPTFKYTRIEVAGVLEWLSAGNSLDELLEGYKGRVSREAIQEAATLAGKGAGPPSDQSGYSEMIVLDEQLLGYGLHGMIARWYRGRVTDLTELRPKTHILDDAVPELLRKVRQPSFVTINVNDFWRRTAPDDHFAILCFPLAHTQSGKSLPCSAACLRYIPFRTRRSRLGKIAQVSRQRVQYYTTDSWAVQTINWLGRK